MIVTEKKLMDYRLFSERDLVGLNRAHYPEASLDLAIRRIMHNSDPVRREPYGNLAERLQSGFRLLKRHSDSPNSEECRLMLGQCYEYGIGCSPDLEEAMRLYLSCNSPTATAFCEGLLLRNPLLDPESAVRIGRRFVDRGVKLTNEEMLQYLIYKEQKLLQKDSSGRMSSEVQLIVERIGQLVKNSYAPAFAYCYGLCTHLHHAVQGVEYDDAYKWTAAAYTPLGKYYKACHDIVDIARYRSWDNPGIRRRAVDFMEAVAMKEPRACVHFVILCCRNLGEQRVRKALQARMWPLISEGVLPQTMIREMVNHNREELREELYKDSHYITGLICKDLQNPVRLRDFTYSGFQSIVRFDLDPLPTVLPERLLYLGLKRKAPSLQESLSGRNEYELPRRSRPRYSKVREDDLRRAQPEKVEQLRTFLGVDFGTLIGDMEFKDEFAPELKDELTEFCRKAVLQPLTDCCMVEAGSRFRPSQIGPFLILNASQESLTILGDLARYLNCDFTTEKISSDNPRSAFRNRNRYGRENPGLIVYLGMEKLSDLEEKAEKFRDRENTYEAKTESCETDLLNCAREGNLVFCLSESTAVGNLIADRSVFEETLVLRRTDGRNLYQEAIRSLPAADGADAGVFLRRLGNCSDLKLNRFLQLLTKKVRRDHCEKLELRHFEEAYAELNRLDPRLFETAIRNGPVCITGNRGLTEFLNRKILSSLRAEGQGGIRFPESFLLYGVPGTGKTKAMEQLAVHLGFEIFRIDASTVYSSFLHQASMKMHKIFEDAGKHAPSMLLIDEVDAFMGDRSKMDRDFEIEEISEFLRLLQNARERQILVVGTSNRIEAIDPAILRPGRIGLHYEVRPCTREDVCDLIRERLEVNQLPEGDKVEMAGSKFAGLTVAVLDNRLTAAFERSSDLSGEARVERIMEELLRDEESLRERESRRIGFI